MPSFEKVLEKERQHIFGSANTNKDAHGVGLAFSGGGIRSATFNLGILQGLAKAKLLTSVNYLSTVSGGGYIGSWLISWILRASAVEKKVGNEPLRGFEAVQDELGNPQSPWPLSKPGAEPEQVSFLRDYSNYLTPRIGIFGADTWAAIGNVLRNIILNQIILVGLLGALVLVPWWVLLGAHRLTSYRVCLQSWLEQACLYEFPLKLVRYASSLFGGWGSTDGDFALSGVAFAFAAILLFVAIAWSSRQTALASYTDTKYGRAKNAVQLTVIFFAILPLFLSALCVMLAIWLIPLGGLPKNWAQPWPWWMILGALTYGLPHVVGVGFRALAVWQVNVAEKNTSPTVGANSQNTNQKPKKDAYRLTSLQLLGIPGSAFVAGAIGGPLLWLLNLLTIYWKSTGHGFALAITWGPLLFVAAFLLVGTIHIGLLKILIQNEEQEWWGRAGGLLLLISLAWTSLFVLSIFVPWLFATKQVMLKTKAMAALAWAGTTLAGVLSGRSSKTSGRGDGNPAFEIVALVSPYIFVVGLMVLISWGSFTVVRHKEEAGSAPVNHSSMTRFASSGEFGAVDSVLSPDEIFWNEIARMPFWKVFGVSIGSALGAILLSLRVDINVFSMNLLYRNRLVRCYLGASRRDCSGKANVCPGRDCRGRHPNPFTGFDPMDDVPLAVLAKAPAPKPHISPPSIATPQENGERESDGDAASVKAPGPQGTNAAGESAKSLQWRRNVANFFQNAKTRWDAIKSAISAKRPPKPVPDLTYDGPYPLLCSTLNMTHGQKLAWQERKAESFIFSPMFCGYEYSDMHHTDKDQCSVPCGYQPTDEYAYPKDGKDPSHADVGGVKLGTAMSISGAAASPNMGYHTSPPLAFLMTMFNVRLGWWLANSRYSSADFSSGFKPKGAPRFALWYLLKELLASTDDTSKFVYLSDGDHFENLATYELIRRRCKYIIVCDADADVSSDFGDLGNMIRKCRSDFGVEITLDKAALLKPDEKTKFATVHAVLGKIQYPGAYPEVSPEANQGWILYIKPTITKDAPRDVLSYSQTHPPFPYQSTGDQWFDESQFESYRRLGYFSFESIMKSTGHDLNALPKDNPLSIEDLFYS